MKYHLEKYDGSKTRHRCPYCGVEGVFVRYIDELGRYLADNVGRCNREVKCGKHYTPAQYFADHKPIINEPMNYIPAKYLRLGYDSTFVEFLCSIFDRYTLESPIIERLMSDYLLVATEKREVGFCQIKGRRVKAVKIIRYNPKTGKRIKDGLPISWLHKQLQREGKLPADWKLEQCLFGEHLLVKYPDKIVCLVEAEKTAIICSGVRSEYLWVAVGGKSNLTAKMCGSLKGRQVILFPDLGCFDDWSAKAKRISAEVGCSMVVTNLLEQIATDTDRQQGLDIADYYIRTLLSDPPRPSIPTTPNEILDYFCSQNPNVKTLIQKLDLQLCEQPQN